MASKLVDAYGRPIDTTKLTEEEAKPSLASAYRSPWYMSVANYLTPYELGMILQQVDQGENLSYLTLAHEMEERDLHYSSVLSTRKLAVSGLEGIVKPAADESKRNVDIAEDVRQLTEEPGFNNMVMEQLDGLSKSYSVNEINWDTSEKQWHPSYVWRDQRFFQFDRETGSQIRLRDEKDPVNGLELTPYKYMYHQPRLRTGLPIKRGLARLAVVAYIIKSYTVKDWMAFIEVYGMPIRIGKHGTGATSVQKSKLLEAVNRIGIDASCIIPEGMEIELMANMTQGNGDTVFQVMADWVDAQVSKGVLGQTMTTEDGSSLGQAEVHDRVRSDIKKSDAKQLEETINRDLIKPYVDLNYGTMKRGEYPRYHFDVSDSADLTELSKSLPPFIKLGMRVAQSEVLDLFGLSEPAEDAEVLGEPQEQDVEGAVLRAMAKFSGMRKAMAQQGSTDAIDELTEEALDGWEKVTGPMVEPFVSMVEKAESYEEVAAQLTKAFNKMDSSVAIDEIAQLLFKARGLGDVKDEA
jgi:phage gp29-like protein